VIVDTSALVAVVREERGYEWLLNPLLTHGAPRIGAPTLFETAMVLIGREGDTSRSRRSGGSARAGIRRG
jgi:uncharacterized protein with PIN domain